MTLRAVALLALVSLAGEAHADRATEATTITIVSEDGLEMTADLYMAHDKSKPMIVLFHQAGWSRGEYGEIALKLAALGYNALAVDARSGRRVNGVANETAARAKKKKLGTKYLDALPDLRAALKVARKTYATGKVIAWGSSYSAALVLYLAGTEPALADATLAFAPGEYFAKAGKSRTWIRSAAASIEKPVFITSARSEQKKWAAIYKAIPAKAKAKFVPKTRGKHGSKALWSKSKDSEAYWKAVKKFLASL